MSRPCLQIWLSEYGNADSTLVFENDCCLLFKASSFQQLDDVRDEAAQTEEEGEEDAEKADKRPIDTDEDEDEDDEQQR